MSSFDKKWVGRCTFWAIFTYPSAHPGPDINKLQVHNLHVAELDSADVTLNRAMSECNLQILQS
jgi:hypothetical protein